MLNHSLNHPSYLVVKVGYERIVGSSHLMNQLLVNRTCLAVENPSVRFQILPCFPCSDVRFCKVLAYVTVEGSLLRRKSRQLSVTQFVG